MSYLPPFPNYRGVFRKVSLFVVEPQFNCIIPGEPLNSGLWNLASKSRNITISCGTQIFRYNEPFKRGL